MLMTMMLMKVTDVFMTWSLEWPALLFWWMGYVALVDVTL